MYKASLYYYQESMVSGICYIVFICTSLWFETAVKTWRLKYFPSSANKMEARVYTEISLHTEYMSPMWVLSHLHDIHICKFLVVA
jgi:hypothetical protein